MESVFELNGSDKQVIHCYSAPLFDSKGEWMGRTEVYSDITKRRKLEAAVKRAYDELKATQELLVQSEKLRSVGEIASGVAHDFNNTLGIILGNIQLLMNTVSDDGVCAKLKRAEQAALDGVETVRRIQEFTRRQPQVAPSLIDLSEMAAELVEMMKPVYSDETSGRKIEVKVDLLPKAPAMGVAAEIRQVLTNIFLNAVQAMPDGGVLTISTERKGTFSCIGIADTGIGMNEEIKNRIFDPFFTTRGVEGTGLGMSVAYGIIKRHEGNISVESEPGNGAKVTILLPTASENSAIIAETLPEEAESTESLRILVVDDEEMFAQVFAEMLSEFGHVVCVVNRGSEAIELVRKEKFDLIFTDLGMPGMSGRQVAEAIKNIQPDIPIVLLTGWDRQVIEEDLGGAPVDMVLSKPIKIENIPAVVAEAMKMASAL